MFEPTASGAPRSSTTIGAGSAPAAGGTGGPAGGSGPVTAAPYTPENEVHLLDRLAVLYRYRRLCVTVFILVTAAMIIQGYSNIKIYQAQARLLIEDERSTAVPGLQNDQNTYFEDPEPYYQTQYKILKGRDLMRRVVRKLHLENVPEFNGKKAPPPTPLSMLADLKTRMMGYISKPQPASLPEPPKMDETADESALVGGFIGRVGVDPVRGTHLVDVTFVSEEPKFAADAVNTLIDEYVSENLEIKLRSTQGMLDWLGNELATQQKRVQESEQALAEYREKENALSLDDKQNIVLARLNQLNDTATRARSTRVQKESLYNQVKAIASGTNPDAIPIIATNANVQNAKTKLGELQRQRVALLERYQEKHPQVINISAQIQDAQKQLDIAITGAV